MDQPVALQYVWAMDNRGVAATKGSGQSLLIDYWHLMVPATPASVTALMEPAK